MAYNTHKVHLFVLFCLPCRASFYRIVWNLCHAVIMANCVSYLTAITCRDELTTQNQPLCLGHRIGCTLTCTRRCVLDRQALVLLRVSCLHAEFPTPELAHCLRQAAAAVAVIAALVAVRLVVVVVAWLCQPDNNAFIALTLEAALARKVQLSTVRPLLISHTIFTTKSIY